MPVATVKCPQCGARLMPTGDVSQARCPCGHEFVPTNWEVRQTFEEKVEAHRNAEKTAPPIA